MYESLEEVLQITYQNDSKLLKFRFYVEIEYYTIQL